MCDIPSGSLLLPEQRQIRFNLLEANAPQVNEEREKVKKNDVFVFLCSVNVTVAPFPKLTSFFRIEKCFVFLRRFNTNWAKNKMKMLEKTRVDTIHWWKWNEFFAPRIRINTNIPRRESVGTKKVPKCHQGNIIKNGEHIKLWAKKMNMSNRERSQTCHEISPWKMRRWKQLDGKLKPFRRYKQQ